MRFLKLALRTITAFYVCGVLLDVFYNPVEFYQAKKRKAMSDEEVQLICERHGSWKKRYQCYDYYYKEPPEVTGSSDGNG
jgi:hypothetical protein